jgi:hypothetical protein
MRVKTNCRHFKWKTRIIVSMNKIDQNLLKKPIVMLIK